MVIAAIVLIVVFTKRSAHGERSIDKSLQKLDIPNKLVIHDLIIPYRNSSSQIDNILVTSKGIYVIECKKYSGDIIGNLEDTYWYEETYSVSKSGRLHSHKYKMYNPIKQNNTHIKALRSLLKVDKSCFHPFICFLSSYPKLDQGDVSLVDRFLLFDKIDKIEKDYPSVFSNKELLRIESILIDYKDNPRVSKQEHVKNVKKNHSDDKMIY